MWELFKQLSISARAGVIGGMIGGLAGAAVAISVEPIGGSIFFGLAFAIVLGGLWMGFGPQIRRNRLLLYGVRTQATVLSIGETGITAQQNYPVAKLRLSVEPPGGGAPYEAKVKALLNRFEIPAYQPGARVEVVVDPTHPTRVAVV
jgi:hypothetical protein